MPSELLEGALGRPLQLDEVPGQVAIARERALELWLDRYVAVEEQTRAQCAAAVADLMAQTDQLRELGAVTSADALDALRHVPTAPVARDRVKLIAETDNPRTSDIVEAVRLLMHKRDYPWVTEDRPASAVEMAAATAVLTRSLCEQRIATALRSEFSRVQERRIEDVLIAAGYTRWRGSVVEDILALEVGTYVRNVKVRLGNEKIEVDALVCSPNELVWVEAKYANDSTNAIKRLLHECGKKRPKVERHLDGLGRFVAVIGGVFDPATVTSFVADGGLVLFDHQLPGAAK